MKRTNKCELLLHQCVLIIKTKKIFIERNPSYRVYKTMRAVV